MKAHVIKNSTYFCTLLILCLLNVKPDISQANTQAKEVAGELALVDSFALEYTDPSVVPKPFSVCFYKGHILISDPKMTSLFSVTQDPLELMEPFPIPLGNHSLQRGSRELAINPVTQELAIPGEHSNSIAILSPAIGSSETEVSQDAEASDTGHKRSPLTFTQSLTGENTDIPSSFKNPYRACYDHSGHVLLVSNRYSSELTAFIKVNDNWQYWDSPKIPAGKAADVAIIIAAQSSSAFYLALNERDESDHYRTFSTVYKLEFNLNDPGSGLNRREWGQWYSPEAVDSSHTTENLRRITGMALTPDSQFLVVVAHETNSVLFYQKNASSGQWQPSATFTDENLQEANSFDGVHSVVSAIPVNDEATCVFVSANQHVHSFVWNGQLSKWQHLKALLIKHKGRSPGLTGIAIDPESGRRIVVIGATTGVVVIVQFSSAPHIEQPAYQFDYDERDAKRHSFLVGQLMVKDTNMPDAEDLSHLTATVYFAEHTNCPFYWENNQVLFNPDCGVSLSQSGGWGLSTSFPAHIQVCNQLNLCSSTSLTVQVTPHDFLTRQLKWGLSLGLSLPVIAMLSVTSWKLIKSLNSRRSYDLTSKDSNKKTSTDWQNPFSDYSPFPQPETLPFLDGSGIEMIALAKTCMTVNEAPSQPETLPFLDGSGTEMLDLPETCRTVNEEVETSVDVISEAPSQPEALPFLDGSGTEMLDLPETCRTVNEEVETSVDVISEAPSQPDPFVEQYNQVRAQVLRSFPNAHHCDINQNSLFRRYTLQRPPEGPKDSGGESEENSETSRLLTHPADADRGDTSNKEPTEESSLMQHETD